jgi:hypothetical protein
MGDPAMLIKFEGLMTDLGEAFEMATNLARGGPQVVVAHLGDCFVAISMCFFLIFYSTFLPIRFLYRI